MLLYFIKYAHDDLVSYLDFFHIPEAIFNSGAFTFYTKVVSS